MNRNFIAPILVAVPKRKEQEAIAGALSDADALIESLEQLVAKKRHLKQGVMQGLLRPKDGWEVKKLSELAIKARDGKLSMADLSGGTFTISNGGTYGSLLSTPILNPPQSGILGMHKIEERPIAVNGQVVVRPMMYVALSYDHR